jgi:hypothetical protein
LKKLFVVIVGIISILLSQATRCQALDNRAIDYTLLFKDYGIRVLPGDTEQSPEVLHSLIFLLKNTLSMESVHKLASFRFIKASADKNLTEEISSFDLEERSIIVPGISLDSAFRGNPKNRIKIIAALAHEIGHAFLFQNISAQELTYIADHFGGWSHSHCQNRAPSSVRSDCFFQHHPKFSRECSYRSGLDHVSLEMRENNITSEYALEDIHEWFAESFAAYLLSRLGEKGLLGGDWKQRLVLVPENKKEYWINYNNISPEFHSWIEARINSI